MVTDGRRAAVARARARAAPTGSGRRPARRPVAARLPEDAWRAAPGGAQPSQEDVRILFTANPGLGHLHPMLQLAQALFARGHEVRWAVAADGCARLAAAGFEAFPCGLAGPERRASF